jgi:hypothetical protein
MGLVRRAVGSRWEAAALLAVLFAMAWVVQGPSNNANSHHLLVRALASGTPIVDDVRADIGELNTTDVAVYQGHFYSNKAPGLAFTALPAYLVLEALGKADDPIVVLWWLGLFALVMPAALMLLLIRVMVERVQPGLGTATVIALGLGTLLLPFSTLFFAHVLSAALAFGAFAALWWEREGDERLLLVGVAGVLVALAATTEHPTLLIGMILFPYALTRERRLRRGAVYTIGALVGLAPQLTYNWWALGSPFRLAYQYGVYDPGASRSDVLNNEVPLSVLVNVPSSDVVTGLLFSSWGLVTAAPVLGLSAVGGYLLYQRGRRAEAVIPAAALAVSLAYVASIYEPFGDTWAPRYLVAIIPLLALPLAAGLAAYPAIGAVLTGGSIALSAVVTITNPMAAWDGHVLDRLFSAGLAGHSRTVLEAAGYVTWWDTLPYFAAVAFAGGHAVVSLLRARPVRLVDASAAAVALAGWILFAQLTPRLELNLRDDVAHSRSIVVLSALLVLVGVVTAVQSSLWRRPRPS